MSYCRECGTALEEGALFCNECGTPVNEEESRSLTNPVQSASARSPLSKKTKLMLIAGAVAVVVLFGVHILLQSLFSPMRLIEDFEQALLEEDTAKVAEMLHTTDNNLEINEDYVQSIMEMFERHPEQVNLAIDHLRFQSESKDRHTLQSVEELFSSKYVGDSSFIVLATTGKFLFYDRYQLVVPTVYLSVNTNYENVEISVDGENVGTIEDLESEATFGPYLPGYHTVKGTLNTDFFEYEKEIEVYLDPFSTMTEEELYFEAEQVEFILPEKEADYTVRLFVNGTDVGVDLSEDPIFGPLMVDGSMTYYVEAEFPWGTVKTEEVPIDDKSLTVNLVTDELVNILTEKAHKYNSEWAETMTTLETDHMTTAISSLKEEIVQKAELERMLGNILQFSYLSSEFDIGSVELFYDEGEWHVSFYGDSYWLEDKIRSRNDEFELEEKTYKWKYVFVYDEDANTWLVTSAFPTFWAADFEETVEFVVEEPAVFTSTWIDE